MSLEEVAEQLCNAVKEETVMQVLRLLLAASDEDDRSAALLSIQCGERKDAVLHAECKAGNLDVVLALLFGEANLEAKDECGKTPLHCANLQLHLRIVKF